MPVFLAPVVILFALFQVLWDMLKKPKYRSLLIWMLLILITGAFFYHGVEGWSWVDSVYFSVMTLATVGYGDLAPTTPGSKIFTIAYVLVGFSVFISFASMLAQERVEIRQTRLGSKENSDQ